MLGSIQSISESLPKKSQGKWKEVQLRGEKMIKRDKKIITVNVSTFQCLNEFSFSWKYGEKWSNGDFVMLWYPESIQRLKESIVFTCQSHQPWWPGILLGMDYQRCIQSAQSACQEHGTECPVLCYVYVMLCYVMLCYVMLCCRTL